jgi:hypothetical protein
MELIRRADIPPHYKEWMKYSETSHRMKSDPDSFYLMNRSANINIYSKYQEVKKRSEYGERKGLPPIPQVTLDAGRNIIRFEVQCKYRKMYAMSKRAIVEENTKINKYEYLLSCDTCNEIINYYFNKTIGSEHWQTLQGAIREIESMNYKKRKKRRLIEALQLVNQCRSLARAKASLQGEELVVFKQTLKELSCHRINPVTIPKDWNVKYIPNLLYTYYDKVQEEQNKTSHKEWLNSNFDDYIKEFGFKHLSPK